MSDADTSNPSNNLRHTTLLNFVRAFAPDLTDAGVCNGFCALWIQAALTGIPQEAEFYARLDWLAEHLEGKQNNTGKFEQLQKNIEGNLNQGLYSEQDLKEENEFLIQLRAFSEAVALCQSMMHLGISRESTSHNNLSSAYPLVASQILQNKNQHLRSTLLGVTVSSKEEIIDYFNTIQKILQQESSAPSLNLKNTKNAFLLTNENHTVAVYFHHSTQKWRFLDINTLSKKAKEHYYYEANTSELADLIFKAFGDEKSLFTAFSIRHVSSVSTRHKNTASETLLKTLGEISPPLNSQKTNSRGKNALYLACMMEHPDTIKKLQTQQVDLEAFFDTQEEMFPLFLAVVNGNIDSVSALVEAHVDVNQINSNGQSALMGASYFGHSSIVDYLLASAPKLNVHLFNPETADTALTIAAEKGYLSIVKSLVGARTDNITEEVSMAFFLAASNGHTGVVSALLAEPNLQIEKNLPDHKGNTALMVAVKNGHLAMCTTLVAAGVDTMIVNHDGESALSTLAKMGITEYELCPARELPSNAPLPDGKIYFETVERVLKYSMRDRQDREVKGEIVLSKHPTYIEIIYKISKNGHADGKIAAFLDLLAISMRRKNLKANHPDSTIINFAPFLYSKANLEALNKNGYTPFLVAVKKDLTSIVQLLLSLYVKPNVLTPTGETALMLALKNPHQNPDMIQILLMETSLIDAIDQEGNTTLTLAIENNDWDTVEELILQGANTKNALALVMNEAPQPIIDLLFEKADDAEKAAALALIEKNSVAAKEQENTLPPLAIILPTSFTPSNPMLDSPPPEKPSQKKSTSSSDSPPSKSRPKA